MPRNLFSASLGGEEDHLNLGLLKNPLNSLLLKDLGRKAADESLSTKQSILNSVRPVAEGHQLCNLKFRKSKSHRCEHPKQFETRLSHSLSAFDTQIWTSYPEKSPKSDLGSDTNLVRYASTLISLLEVNLESERQARIDKNYRFLTEGLLKEKSFDYSYLGSLKRKELASVLITYATGSKEESMSLQSFISECPSELITSIREELLRQSNSLITHNFGSYVIQRLIVRDLISQDAVSKLCQKKFSTFMHNEFSSRVMQLLIECSPTFRTQATKKLKTIFLTALDSGAASHLIKACIKNSNDPKELDFIIFYLERNPTLTSKKLFRNVLMAFVQRCPTSQLQKVVKLLRLEQRILFYLNSKSFTSLLFVLLERGEEQTTSVIFSLLRYDPLRAFACRCFHQLLGWIVSNETENNSLIRQTGLILANLPTSVVSKLLESDCFQFYLYVVVCSLKDRDHAGLSCFLSRDLVSQRVAALTGIAPPISGLLTSLAISIGL